MAEEDFNLNEILDPCSVSGPSATGPIVKSAPAGAPRAVSIVPPTLDFAIPQPAPYPYDINRTNTNLQVESLLPRMALVNAAFRDLAVANKEINYPYNLWSALWQEYSTQSNAPDGLGPQFLSSPWHPRSFQA